MDDIGAAAGVTGPAIYRHFGAKASVLTAVFDRVIDAVTIDPDVIGELHAADRRGPGHPAAAPGARPMPRPCPAAGG